MEDSPAVAVFGSSEPAQDTPAYEQAERLGVLLARAGFRVITGGYGGVMEAASRGAAGAHGHTLGVTCEVFDRRANGFLSRELRTADLFERTRELIDRADGYVVLPGKSGTLAELTFLWAMKRAGCLDRRPVILLGDEWRALLRHLVRAGILEPAQFDVTRVVDTPEEALDWLHRQLLEDRRGRP